MIYHKILTQKTLVLAGSLILISLLVGGFLPVQAQISYQNKRVSSRGPVQKFPVKINPYSSEQPSGVALPPQVCVPKMVDYAHDDGGAEIYVGSAGSIIVVANRFVLNEQAELNSVSFYTSALAAGQPVDVIIYEDPSGTAQTPKSSLEVLRLPVTLQALSEGEFHQVLLPDQLLLNTDGGDGVFFVALASTMPILHYSLGVDMTGPKAGASYVSLDQGQTFDSLADFPVVDGNAMIRARVKACGSPR